MYTGPVSQVAELEHADPRQRHPVRSLAEQAYEAIRDDIVFLRLEPGEPLDDKQLSAALGMGLTPVRDALKRLTLERMVVTYPRRGTFVAEITVSDEQWLTEIRQNLEGVAAALAAERATEAERESLTELAGTLADDHANHLTTEYHALDARIHKAIYAAAHNPYLESGLTQYLNLTLRIWHYGLRRVSTRHSAGRDQQDVVAAIVRGDAAAAAEAARAHLGDYSIAVRSLLSR
jgi:DNA-binding GntR family transcriptional regulator